MPLSSAKATTSLDVVINEIAFAGTKEGWYFEWIELANNTKGEIDLSGWEIKNAGAKNKTLELEGKILPYDFFLICKKEMEGCGLESWRLSLNDNHKENGSLILESKDKNIVDQTPIPAGSRWPAGDKETKQTMERIDRESPGLNIENWQTSQSTKGTPGAKNNSKTTLPATEATPSMETSFEKPPQCSKDIIVNEILPSPEGQDSLEEWIELFNKNFFTVDLSFFQIQDTSGKTKKFIIPQGTLIESQSFHLLKSPETKITLNNEGDGLKLFCPDGELIDEIYYQKAVTGKSFCRINNEWLWCKNPTPAAENLQNNNQEIEGTEKNALEMSGIESSPEKNSEKNLSKNFFFNLSFGTILALPSSLIVYYLKRKLN